MWRAFWCLEAFMRCSTCRQRTIPGNGRSWIQSLGQSCGDLGFFLGEVTETQYNSKIERTLGTPLPISQDGCSVLTTNSLHLQKISPSLSLGRSLGDLGFYLGEVTEKLYNSKSKENPGMPLPISLRWLGCVDDNLSALAVNFSLSPSLGCTQTRPPSSGSDTDDETTWLPNPFVSFFHASLS